MSIRTGFLLMVTTAALVGLLFASQGCKKTDCKPDQTRCEKCGLVKDSPGCCKIPIPAP